MDSGETCNKKVVRVIKLEIKKPLSGDFKKFYHVLNRLCIETCKIQNESISIAHSILMARNRYKYLNEVYPEQQEFLDGYKSVSGFIYNDLKDKYIATNTSNLSGTIRIALERYNALKKDFFNGKCSIPSYKNNKTIYLHNNSVDIKEDGVYFNANVRLLSKRGAVELETDSLSFLMAVVAKDSYAKKIMDDLVNKTVKLGTCQIKNKKNKWYLFITYTSEKFIAPVLTQNVMSVRWGFRTPFSVIVDGTDIRIMSKVEADEVTLFFKRSKDRQSKLQSLAKYAGVGSEGHGFVRKLREVKTWGDRVARFKESMNHKYSKRIVDYAIKHRCSDITLPASPVDSDELFLKPWAWYQFYNMITVKAEAEGIKVSVLPRETEEA